MRNGPHQGEPAFVVDGAGALNMSLEVPLLNEIAQNALFEHGQITFDAGFCQLHNSHQRRWQNEKGEANNRVKHFPKRGHVDDRAMLIQRLQRWNWATAVAVLTVIVIFYDEGTHVSGIIEQLQPSWQRERHSCGS